MHWLRPYNRNSPSRCSSPISKSSSQKSSSNSLGRITLHKITDIDDPTDNPFILTGNNNQNWSQEKHYTRFLTTYFRVYTRFLTTYFSGYRSRLNFLDCMRSLFLLHNETINIWSHILGFAFFAGLFACIGCSCVSVRRCSMCCFMV